MKLKSVVIKGKGQASSFNVPTANLVQSDVLGEEGVYAVKIIKQNESFNGVSYFGKAWLLSGAPQQLEVHLFDYDGDPFYGEEIEVEFLQKLRDPIKFENESQAVEQIQEDINQAKKYFSE